MALLYAHNVFGLNANLKCSAFENDDFTDIKIVGGLKWRHNESHTFPS